MATKKSKAAKPVAESKEIAVPVVLTAANIIESDSAEKYADVNIPEFLKSEGAFEKEAPTGFTPLIQFGDNAHDWKPGSWIIARYLSTREGIGPNASAMYDFEVTRNGKEFFPASLWGSTIFDNKFRLLNPRAGQWIFIQYLGLTDTSRRMNPAKDFRLAIVAEEKIKGLGYGNAPQH